ncbi:MAG: hypothetical protein HY231_17525, partial [Acidobacteria bacterium]|nr:hypothetical protein [Acidobacteriota bacterium]
RFAYTVNDPVNTTDPLGLDPSIIDLGNGTYAYRTCFRIGENSWCEWRVYTEYEPRGPNRSGGQRYNCPPELKKGALDAFEGHLNSLVSAVSNIDAAFSNILNILHGIAGLEDIERKGDELLNNLTELLESARGLRPSGNIDPSQLGSALGRWLNRLPIIPDTFPNLESLHGNLEGTFLNKSEMEAFALNIPKCSNLNDDEKKRFNELNARRERLNRTLIPFLSNLNARISPIAGG